MTTWQQHNVSSHCLVLTLSQLGSETDCRAARSIEPNSFPCGSAAYLSFEPRSANHRLRKSTPPLLKTAEKMRFVFLFSCPPAPFFHSHPVSFTTSFCACWSCIAGRWCNLQESQVNGGPNSLLRHSLSRRSCYCFCSMICVCQHQPSRTVKS